jgi:hypothetical protein
MKAAMTAALGKLIELVKAALSLKFDKTGGEISGNVKISGNLTLDIPNEDYDAGITLSKALDDNLGTVLQLQGYAHGEEQTWYRAVLRGVAEPASNYDAANKKYVDDHVALPTYHLVFLNADGTVDTHASSLVYATVLSNLTNPLKRDVLDVIWGTTRFHCDAVETVDVQNGDVKFIGEVEYQGLQRNMVFTLNPQSVLATTNIVTFEGVHNKAQSVVANSQSAEKYPSTAAVFNEFERKPVVVWEVQNASQGLLALNTNISANLAWQLTGLDLTPYSRIKIFAKAGRKTGATAADSSITPAVILEMSLDDRAKETVSQNVFIGSILFQNPNDANRLGSLTCAVSADKTKFAVTRATSLYGTAATSNTDTYQYVFKIEGFYE